MKCQEKQMLNRSLNRLKYANKPRDPVPAVEGELGVCRKGGALWSAQNCRGTACLVGMLAHQQWGTWGMCPATGLVEINVLWWPVYPRGIKIWCQVASKQMGETFPWRKEHQGEVPHVRRRYFKLNSQQAKTVEKNKPAFRNFWCKHREGTQRSVLRKITLSPLRFLKFTCCERLAFVAAKGQQIICFHPLQKKSLVFMNSMWDQICHHFSRVLQKGEFFQLSLLERSMFSHYLMSMPFILSSCFYWTLWSFQPKAHISKTH